MKIESINIHGFRGFNEERNIKFHDRLTLISAPNSYGKTSITEAFEWLLYGITSKVEKADSKEEYRGSYRNSHLPESYMPSVSVTFIEDGNKIEFKGILSEDESITRYVNDEKVESWPFEYDLAKTPKPFVFQHALKYLLLTSPSERFQGFAHILGLEKLERIQKDVISLCTKPDSRIPDEISRFLEKVSALEARLAGRPDLFHISKALKKGEPGMENAFEAVISECKKRIPDGTKTEPIIPQLLKIREEAVSKIYKGRISLQDYSEAESQINAEEEGFFLNCITNEFIQRYTDISALGIVQLIIEKAKFYNLGVALLCKTPEKCPFCGQTINDELLRHIYDDHKKLKNQADRNRELQDQQAGALDFLKKLGSRLNTYQDRHIEKASHLLELKPSLGILRKILVPKQQSHYEAVESAVLEITTARNNLTSSFDKILEAIVKVEKSITESKEDTSLVKVLGECLIEYISRARSYVGAISGKVSSMSAADKILKHELDKLAGTEDISVLIDILEKRSDIEKNFKIKAILDSLKDLRKTTEQYVATRVLEAISSELTSEVMEWYNQIKTTGDPDVHFNGFDMDRTKKGDLKARRVQIKAKSYDKELVSAVSSLSESKLNALGLCLSIATNLKGESPFEFLIFDDPIQSWDADHETQFIEVIRKLVERGKQVILMSHNHQWIDRVRKGCRTMNGFFYEITGYTEAGPFVKEAPWAKWKERLLEVDAILKAPKSSGVKLQQAEEEIRIAIAEITSELYSKIKGVGKASHDLNSTKVRKMLIECGIDNSLVDRITQTFETTNDAHHAPNDYAANKQRIQRYHAWAHELAKLLKV